MSLARRYKLPLKILYTLMDSDEIMQEMAYDMTQSEDFKKKWTKEDQLEESRSLSESEMLAAFKRLLGGK